MSSLEKNGLEMNTSGIILLQNEPLGSILHKWLAWIIVLVLFVASLIYFTGYFSKSSDCARLSNGKRHRRRKMLYGIET